MMRVNSIYLLIMKAGLKVGHTGELRIVVGAEHVIHLGADEPGGGLVVYSTPNMINLMEHAAREALKPYLEAGEESVGVTVDMKHTGATPIGTDVRATARVTGIDGRLVDFEVVAYDGEGEVGRGSHRRAVVSLDKIKHKVNEKAQQMGVESGLPMSIEVNGGALPKFETLKVENEAGPVMKVVLNRAEKLNAVNEKMTGEIEQLVQWLAGHAEEVRVVVITGEGRAFCAGDDVPEVGTLELETARELSYRQARMYLAFEQLPQVIIAAVNGDALGGGCVLAYSCDLRIAGSAVEFGMPEILLGWPPGYGIAQLTALVGKARAIELCVTGKVISAQTAMEWGLVNEVVPGGRLMSIVEQWAERLVQMPAQALRETKRLVHQDEGLQSKIGYLADTGAYIRCLALPDAKEGIAAFSEKRAARFEGK